MDLPDPHRSRAVLIGVGEYRKDRTLTPLPAARNNVTDFAKIITDPRYWGLPPEHCVPLIDPEEASTVAMTVARMAEEAQDTFIMYFSGHGLVAPDGDLILALANTDHEKAQFSGLRYEWIREAVRGSTARRRIVILDCCFSGRALTAMSDARSLVIGQIDIEGIYVITAAPANRPAIAPVGQRHTAFTGSLINVFRTGVSNGPEYLRLSDIYHATLHEMARAGRPRPQQLGTNTVAHMALVRNAAWRLPQATALHVPRPVTGAGLELAAGVRAALCAVRPTLGPTGRDALTAIRTLNGGRRTWRVGVELLHEAALTMRSQYGDGAATAALVSGVLIIQLDQALERGEDPVLLGSAIESSADRIRTWLRAQSRFDNTVEQVKHALFAALGHSEVAQLVADGVARVGARNVAIAAVATPGSQLDMTSRVTLATRILSPNAPATPLTLRNPLIAVVLDDRLEGLSTAGEMRNRSLLLIAPRISVSKLRRLLHTFSRIVVVRPLDPNLSLDHLRSSLGPFLNDLPKGQLTRRALITDSATTIIGVADQSDQEVDRAAIYLGRQGGESDDEFARRLASASRALAITRAAEDSGVYVGGGTALYHVSQRLAKAADTGIAGLICGALASALAEPMRQIVQNAGGDPGSICSQLANGAPGSMGFNANSAMLENLAAVGVVDPVVTVEAIFAQSIATAARYLSLV